MWVELLIVSFVCIVLMVLVGAIIGHQLLKYVFKEMQLGNYTEYSSNTREMLAKYDGYKIKRAFMVCKRVSRTWLFGFYILRLVLSDNLKQCALENDIFHHSLLLEISNGVDTKLVTVDKTYEIRIRDKFGLSGRSQLVPIPIKRATRMTIAELLDRARKIMYNDELFFNWRTHSTCQTFIGHLLAVLRYHKPQVHCNDLAPLSSQDRYIMNNLLYYSYKLMKIIQIDNHIFRLFGVY